MIKNGAFGVSYLVLLLLGIIALVGPSTVNGSGMLPASGVPIVANMGQWSDEVAYKIVGHDFTAWLVADGLVFALAGYPDTSFGVSWDGLQGQPAGHTPHPTQYSYYYGPDETDWHRDVPVWAQLDWGQWQLRVDAAGLVVLGPEPAALQSVGATVSRRSGEYRISFGDQDANLPIRFVTDWLTPASMATPSVGFSTFIGAPLWDQADDIAVDLAGNSYTTGYSTSLEFPGDGGFPAAHGVDIFLTKLNPAGSALDYVLHVNPNPKGLDTGQDYGQAIAVDAGGHAYLVGRTDSPDFPRTTGSYDDDFQGPTDAYVLKFMPDGSDLVYGTFINGSISENFDDARALVLDDAGNAYVAGGTFSPDLLPAGLPGFDNSHAGERDGFVVKLSADGSQLLWGSYLGGDSQETVTGIDLGQDGAVYVGGWTRSGADFPTTVGAYDTSFAGDFDGFVTAIEPAGTQLRYSTYVGGMDEDRVLDVAVDESGRVVAAGSTSSADLPATPNAFDNSCGTDGNCNEAGGFLLSDGFVLKLNASGSLATYLTFLGGEQVDLVNAVALDDLNRPLLTGRTESAQYPTTADAIDAVLSGAVDAFLTRMSLSGDRLDYSSYLGGSDWDMGLAIVARADNQIFVTGWTRWSTAGNSDFPVTMGSYDTVHNGDYDIFVTTYQFPVDERVYLPIVNMP